VSAAIDDLEERENRYKVKIGWSGTATPDTAQLSFQVITREQVLTALSILTKREKSVTVSFSASSLLPEWPITASASRDEIRVDKEGPWYVVNCVGTGKYTLGTCDFHGERTDIGASLVKAGRI
jgi:hypothetical protein